MKGSEFVNLRLLDHLIISEEGYFGFLDEGMLATLNNAKPDMHNELLTTSLQLSNA